MAVNEDWLALPGEEQGAAEKNSEPQLSVAVVTPAPPAPLPTSQLLVAPKLSEGALVATEKYSTERRAFLRAWELLTLRQRAYLRAMQKNAFRHPVALKVVNATLPPGTDSRGRKEHKLQWQTPSRWARTDENYRLVMATLKAEAVAQTVTRDDLLIRANNIAELALEGEPVYGVNRKDGGHEIIGHEKKLDTALRANEQLAKMTKVLGGDDNRGAGGGNGPALVIQVIQQGGKVVDVTPRGVTIDLPAPDGA